MLTVAETNIRQGLAAGEGGGGGGKERSEGDEKG